MEYERIPYVNDSLQLHARQLKELTTRLDAELPIARVLIQ
jgi:phosphoribosyl-dephospho-CoA transferase